ncbi:hypothetical protein QE152_g5423 [Popillia japonica]|uniref:Uncharacterized protein n=1 Tax=Popillia japonica TaxID=7064 RepID=A0AAW1MM78_POPJA
MDNNITIEPSPRAKGRQRIANKQEWKREKAKSKRYSRQHLPEFPTCGHRTKTMQCCLLTMTEIRKFNEGFYQKKNKLFQDMFVLKHCVTSKPKRPGTKIKENSRNKSKAISCRVKYNIKTSKGTIPVCKKTFVAKLGIGKNRLQRIVSRCHHTGGLPAENRGGDQISHKTAAKTQAIKNFIEGLNCCETHYACNKTIIRRYLAILIKNFIEGLNCCETHYACNKTIIRRYLAILTM